MADTRRLLAALLLVLGAAVGCSSDAPAKKADGPGCDLPARFDPFHDSHVVVDLGYGFELRDPGTNAVVAACRGSLVTSDSKFLPDGVRLPTNYGYDQVHLPVSAAPLSLVPADAGLARLDSTPDASEPADALLDPATGAESRVAAAKGRVVLAVAGDRIVIGRRQTRPRSPRADDFCVLPSRTAALTACTPIPGAQGTGFPTVHSDGSLGWVPPRVVPARFGSLRGWATTDGTVITSFSRFRPGSGKQEFERVAIAADGRSLAYAWDDNHLSWGVVRSITRTGVVGTGYSTPHAESSQIQLHGMTVSADGTALVVTTSFGRVFRVHDGSARVDTLPPFPPTEYTRRFLVHWPDATG